MKKIYKVSKLFTATIIFYALFLVAGVALIFVKGVQKGVDFQSGLVAKVRFAPTVLALTYEGTDSVTFSQDTRGIHIVTTSINAENKTESFLFSEYKTVGDFIAGSTRIVGLKAESKGADSVSLASLFTSSTEGTRLSSKALNLYSLEPVSTPLSADSVRKSLSDISGLTVQQVGEEALRTFQFRLADNDPAKNTSDNLKSILTAALVKTYGAGNFAYLSSDFMGSQFSAALVQQSALLVLFSIVLIFLYVMVRFKWNFSLAAIVALVFDTFTMVVYMVLMRMEFSTFTVAALLTIIGYSVNDTVVMFDRIRENTRLFPDMISRDIIDKSITEVFGRSVITTVTTIAAVLILFLFTEGSTRDFANVLLVGLISGVITTLLIAPIILDRTCGAKRGQEIIKSKVAA